LAVQNWGKCYYSVDHEGESVVLNVDCESYLRVPSLEDDSVLMSHTCEQLIKNKNVTKIRLSQKRDYEYSIEETSTLKEVALYFNELSKKPELFALETYEGKAHLPSVSKWVMELKNLLIVQLKSDPIGAFIHLIHLKRNVDIALERTLNKNEEDEIHRIKIFVDNVHKKLEQMRMILLVKNDLPGYSEGDRTIYSCQLFTERSC